MEIHPIKLSKIEERAANIYEAVIVAGRKARQINEQRRHEFNEAISTIVTGPEDDFDDRENPDQLRFSLEFDKQAKPHITALQELLKGKVDFRYKDK